jgi:hypothetical protein
VEDAGEATRVEEGEVEEDIVLILEGVEGVL